MPRYEVHRREHHGGGLYELEITIRWDVVDTATGRVVRTIDDEESASYDGVGWAAGCTAYVVDVSVDETDPPAAVIRYRDDRTVRVPLDA